MSLVQKYLHTLIKLLPSGKAWSIDPDSDTYRLLSGFAPELARVDERVQDLLKEMHPQTAVETFERWEEEFGTPYDCGGLAVTIPDRRQAILTKMISLGGQSEAYFKSFFPPEAGDVTFTYPKPTNVGASVGVSLDNPNLNTIIINIPNGEMDYFEAGDMTGDPLVQGAHSVASCLVEKFKPAHRHVLFTYDPGV